MRIRHIFENLPCKIQIFDTFLTDFKISKVVKRGHSVTKLSKISCESLIKGVIRGEQVKKGVNEWARVLKRGQNVRSSPSPI